MFRCPKCGNKEKFTRNVSCSVTIDSNGNTLEEVDNYFSDGYICCNNCKYDGYYREFYEDNQTDSNKELKYSNETPLDSGYYWYRLDSSDFGKIYQVIVRFDINNPSEFSVAMKKDGKWVNVQNLLGEFAGPIEEPE